VTLICLFACWLECDLVDIAPDPVFTRFERLNERMIGGMEVFGRVLVRGRIAAANMTADLAQTKVDPPVAGLQAFLAALRGARFDISKLIEM
jgi:hypothetical protein